MTSDKWDLRFLSMAALVGSWSKDPSTQCGAVIADQKKRVVSVGFNGFPRGVADDPEHLEDRNAKYPRVIHAEVNALLFAQRPVEGCSIYVWPVPPCSQCTSKIVQAGILRIVAGTPSEQFMERWGEDARYAQVTQEQAGVELVLIEGWELPERQEICRYTRSAELSGEASCAIYRHRFGSSWCNQACAMYSAMEVSRDDYRASAWATRGSKDE